MKPPMRPTLGRHSARLARLRHLVRERAPGLAVVDGPKLVCELLSRGVEVVELYATGAALATMYASMGERALAGGIEVFEVEPTVLERVAPTRHTQGAIAVVRHRPRALDLVAPILFLDRVQDPANVGAAIRCAGAFGGGGVACSPGCGDPYSPKAVRASAGLSLTFPVAVDVDLAGLAGEVRAAGGAVVGATASGGLEPRLWRPRLPLVLALGSEGGGLSEGTPGALAPRPVPGPGLRRHPGRAPPRAREGRSRQGP